MANCRFNADANTGHGFAILLASVGALRASRSGAGNRALGVKAKYEVSGSSGTRCEGTEAQRWHQEAVGRELAKLIVFGFEQFGGWPH
jgi:hypothetical protein